MPRRAARPPAACAAIPVLATLMPGPAHASLLSGEALDTMADVIAWIALIIVPIVLISVFWIVHILPEKIAHKRRHPQLAAIKTLCLLSLFFGGLLWPLAWLWAYTKPVLHKLAYGTDQDDHDDHDAAITPFKDAKGEADPLVEQTPVPAIGASAASAPVIASTAPHAELEELRRRLRALEMAVAMSPGPGRASPPTGGGTGGAGGGKGT
ncbi:hypothetical protein CSC65_03060 [Pseudoxanthomonas daejeonensis]|uniref:DUF3302 domain-containing protein n=2 Tax=Pseudoxanthomonas daejeonensis TaxID=266062 RepID=A0ABQ6ZB38_9GAMM|nr:hypothetical protein CSC65_03060 [Pseudoxanthomonas daejeonensis]